MAENDIVLEVKAQVSFDYARRRVSVIGVRDSDYANAKTVATLSIREPRGVVHGKRLQLLARVSGEEQSSFSIRACHRIFFHLLSWNLCEVV